MASTTTKETDRLHQLLHAPPAAAGDGGERHDFENDDDDTPLFPSSSSSPHRHRRRSPSLSPSSGGMVATAGRGPPLLDLVAPNAGGGMDFEPLARASLHAHLLPHDMLARLWSAEGGAGGGGRGWLHLQEGVLDPYAAGEEAGGRCQGERELVAGRLLPLLSRPGAVGVSLVSVESYGNFKASTSGRILVLQNGDTSAEGADVLLVSRSTCPRFFKMLFGALWGNSALHLHHQELPEDCAFLLVGSAMLQARPAPAPLPVPRQHMEHPVVEGTVKLLKLRGLLVAQDEAAARAALYGLPIGYSPVVLRSFGDRYFHDFLNHGLPVPYLLARTCKFGTICNIQRCGLNRVMKRCKTGAHPGDRDFVPTPLVACPDGPRCPYFHKYREYRSSCVYNHDAETGLNTISIPNKPAHLK